MLAPSGLPVPLTALVGREPELATITEAVKTCRLVTLTGPGGVGKTRMAVEAAQRLAVDFADGVAFADLASMEDPALVPVAVAGALGLAAPDIAMAEQQLSRALRSACLLLVVDNLEHLVEQAPLFGRLLAAARGLHVLVTSRIPLHLYGEHQFRVPPLSLGHEAAAGSKGVRHSEAVELFVQRARAVSPGFDPQGPELDAIVGICTLLAGLPLAIELAAARARLLLPPDLLVQLRARQVLLEGGPRDRPRRQQALRATLDWSFDLLVSAERDLFTHLGVFAGPFDPEAAVAVSTRRDPPEEVLGRLAALSDQSLVEGSAGSPPRFWLLQPVREYALARLAETGRSTEVHERHLRHYLGLAADVPPGDVRSRESARIDRLEGELANIRAALDWSRARAEAGGTYLEEGLRLATAMSIVWCRRASIAEGGLYLERLLAVDSVRPAAGPSTRAWALVEASRLQCFGGNYRRTVALAEEGLALFEALGDVVGQAWAHRFLGEAAISIGDLETARPHFTRQLAFAEELGDRFVEAEACNCLGQLIGYQGRYEEAGAVLRRGLQAYRAAGVHDGVGAALSSLGVLARDAGQAELALSLFREALAVHLASRSNLGVACDLEGVAASLALSGHGRAALVYLGAAGALREASGAPSPPVEQAIMARLMDGAIGSLSPEQREKALAAGRERPLSEVVAEALGEASDVAVAE
jgi:predicted ATPase